MKIKLFLWLFLFVIAQNGFAQSEKSVLNTFKYLVVKPNNKHIEYSDIIKNAIETKFREKGFNTILPQTALYSSEYNPCEIVTCEYNLTMISGTNPEMLTELNFFDCNYTIVYSTKEKGKYTFFNEKSTTKHINGHLTVFYDYKYIYQPKMENKTAEPLKETNTFVQRTGEEKVIKAPVEKDGKYFALIIGISDYDDVLIPDLDNLPTTDAEKLSNVLQNQYTFLTNDVTLLKNPTRREIVIALDNLSQNATKNDNVLIFYAGHGHYDSENQIGYWLPKDAEMANTSNWIYNDQLVASIKKIKSKHTLLISDACFSGSIFKSRSINLQSAGDALKKKYELPSRKAITSGTLKTVPNVSIFMKYLLDRLSNTPEEYTSAGQLFQSIEIPVGNNSPTTPQYGVIQNVGDEGGDFIFIRKK